MAYACCVNVAEELREQPPVGAVYCEAYVYLHRMDPRVAVQKDLSVAVECRHPHALVATKDWGGITYRRVPPWERNAANDCPDFVRRTFRRYCRVYRREVVVVGLVVTALLVAGLVCLGVAS